MHHRLLHPEKRPVRVRPPLLACLRSHADVFRRLETAFVALIRSLTFPVAPRAPRERSLAPAWLRHTHPKMVFRVHSIRREAFSLALVTGQAVSPRNVFRRVSVPRTLGAWCMLRDRPARGNLEASAPSSLACPCSFASTSSSASIRASSPRPHRDPRRSPTSERDQRHVVPTSAAHILSLSKTSSAHASRVTTGFTTPSLRPFHSPMECPVSRRAHPASAGLPRLRPSVVFSLRTQKTVPLTSRHFPGHQRPLQALPPDPSAVLDGLSPLQTTPSSLPPHLRVDVRFVPSQDAFHQQALPERERPRTRVTRCRLE